jgi:hypothetical protein
MVYHDDQMPPSQHQRLPCDPWDDWSCPPAAPSDEQRQLVRAAIDARPNHGASRIKSDLWSEGHDVPLNVIYGVKTGM